MGELTTAKYRLGQREPGADRGSVPPASFAAGTRAILSFSDPAQCRVHRIGVRV